MQTTDSRSSFQNLPVYLSVVWVGSGETFRIWTLSFDVDELHADFTLVEEYLTESFQKRSQNEKQ